jgi:protein-disulfide isomerase
MAFLLGFLGGSLWKENQMLKSGNNKVQAQDEVTAQAAAKKLEAVPAFDAKTDHFRGNAKAKVVMIEYSDYECPYCNKFHPTMIELLKKYPNDIAWVYRHYRFPFILMLKC